MSRVVTRDIRPLVLLLLSEKSQAVRCCALSFPLVGNAHQAFRGGKRGRMTFGQSTDKYKNDEYTLKHAAPVRRRAFRYNHVYILAVGAGAPTMRFGRMRRKTKR